MPFPDTPWLVLLPPSILYVRSLLFVGSMGEGQHHSSLEVQQGLQPLAGGCGAICKADAAEMPKELQTIVSEAVDVTVDNYEVCGFTHGGPSFVPKRFRLPLCVDDNDDVLPHKNSLEDKPISFLPIPVNGGGQPMRAVCQLGAERQLLRGGNARGTEHGFTGSQRPWHS